MAESMDAGIETRSMQTVLGMEDEGISTSDTYNIVVKDHGVKSGLKFDSVCITPVADVSYEDEPEKTLQVLYTRDKEQHGGLNYATVAIYDTPRVVDESVTTSKIVRLRSSTKESRADAAANVLEEGVFSSDADTLNSIRYGPTNDNSEASEQQGIFASDPDTVKYIHFGPQPGASGPSSAAANTDEPEGIFASDPEALKFIKFGPKPATSAAANTDEPEGIFASDPEALKFIKFGPKSGMAGAVKSDGVFASDPEALKFICLAPRVDASNASYQDEPEGVFASDPEALKFIKFGPKPTASTAASAEEPEGVFASDQEALKFIKFGRKPANADAAATNQKVLRFGDSSAQPDVADGEGDVLAEATGLQLKDHKAYSVRVTGHDLPDGQLKKFVSVRSVDGRGGQTSEEMDRMEVSVETSVGEDGMVEKFVVVE